MSFKKIKSIVYIISWCLIFCGNLFSEIEIVYLKWTPLLCTNPCIALLDKELKKAPGIAEVILNQAGGSATIKWKPNYPFSFSDVNVPMRLVGLSVRDIHLRVRGTLSHDAYSVTLTSLGDNTSFQLLNPVVTTPGQQAPVFNLQARQLQPELHQKLVDAEVQKATVTIQGQLFMPGRSSAMQLVVDSLKIDTSDKKDKKS